MYEEKWTTNLQSYPNPLPDGQNKEIMRCKRPKENNNPICKLQNKSQE